MSESAYQFRRSIILSQLADYQKELQICDAIGEIEGAGRLYISTYGHRVDIDPTDGVTARQLALTVLSMLKAKGNAPTKVEKSFDASTGKVAFTIPGPMEGFTIRVSGGEPKCRVKEVIEEYEVPEKPAVAAHMATRKRFVIENPEECGAEVKE